MTSLSILRLHSGVCIGLICSRASIHILCVCVLFAIREDMYAQDSIELLTTSGIQFKKHEDEGIETLYFAELLMTSGVVLCDGVKWLSFHRYAAAFMPSLISDFCRATVILVVLSAYRWIRKCTETTNVPKSFFQFLLAIKTNILCYSDCYCY